MPRCFTAIDIPESIRRKLAWLDLPASGLARLTSPDDLHITLHFLGEVSDSLIDALQTGLRSVKSAPFVLELNGVGVFANQGRHEILWAGVQRTPELLAVHNAVGEVLKSLGIKLEDREFNPHVTVARMKRTSPDVVARFVDRNSTFHARFTATSFSLYSVAPHGQESHYRVVEEVLLRNT